MTILDHPYDLLRGVPRARLALFACDLYRDIHKGIRAELFALTSAAGSLDPGDECALVALADHVRAVASLLESHREHEDAGVLPAMIEHLPELADHIEAEHPMLEARFGEIVELASATADATQRIDQRTLAHNLYLELSEYTGSYLAHQLIEERVIMPALERALGADTVATMHVAIVSSIPPDELAKSLAFMLPAMNIDDRTELLGGIQASAPAEAFAAIVSLTNSVLPPADFTALAQRLGIG